MAYVAGTVFKERAKKPIPAEFAENVDISGEEWSEEGGELARMFPRLWQKYNGGE